MAQYGIIRIQKFKKEAITGIQKHNQREGKESKNKDIDSDRTILNYDLVNQEKIKYHKKIKEMTNARVKRKIRADAVLLSEFFISASPEYMNELSDGQQKVYFQEAYEHIAEKYGEHNILYATVHYDESTPHMHVGLVPITDDGRLAAKNYFHGKTKIRAIQDDFHTHMSMKGFKIERGISSELKHKSVHEFKKEERQKELKQLEQQLTYKEKEIKRIDTIRQIKEEGPVEIRNDRRIEELYTTPLNIDTSKTAFGGKVKLEQDDFDRLMDLTKELQSTLAAEHQRTNALSEEVDRNGKENRILKEQLEDMKQDLSVHVSHQDGEVETAKKQMREKLVRDFSAEQKENVKEEVKRVLDTEYKAHISHLSNELTTEKQKHKFTKELLKKENEASDNMTEYVRKITQDYVPREQFDKVNKQVDELKKENNTLKAWKEKALNWIDKNVEKMKKISFFQHVGGIQKRRKEQEIER
ncbi:MobV family relaxase [Priestia megaterium]|uniref:MobV family relaxase n=1 Tax=Priestia megaterium TaxID=1404 RepID=UPI002FFE416B